MGDRWLSVKEAAKHFGSETGGGKSGGVMRVYRRIWAGELVVANVAIEGNKPHYKVSLRSIEKYFTDRQMTAPSRGLTERVRRAV